MAKKDREQFKVSAREEPTECASEMSLEEAKAYRASLYKPEKNKLSEQEKKEKFRVFWAMEKQKYGKLKNLEAILWEHLKASKLDEPEQFEDGLKHFGLKKVR